jgi:hypothetical protein
MKIYSDKHTIATDTPHTIMLFPFWGLSSDVITNNPTLYKTYIDMGKNFFEMSSLEDADVIVAPVAWEKNEASRKKITELAQYATPKKPIIIFFWHDSTEDVPVPNSVIFRTSFYKSTQKPNEYAMPAWGEDFIQSTYQGKLVIRQKQAQPVIGFCGYAMTRRAIFTQAFKDIGRYIKDGIRKTNEKRQKRAYHILRANLLKKLAKNKSLKANFIIRSQFYGKVLPERKQLERQEYIENIITSDYVLCVRGAGNFSYRLYETLSSGRIPVFVNTDCVLPYDFEINWKDYCVWVEESEIDQIDRKIADFHAKLTPEAFVDLQKRCRQLWEDYLSPEGFFKNFYRHFEK